MLGVSSTGDQGTLNEFYGLCSIRENQSVQSMVYNKLAKINANPLGNKLLKAISAHGKKIIMYQMDKMDCTCDINTGGLSARTEKFQIGSVPVIHFNFNQQDELLLEDAKGEWFRDTCSEIWLAHELTHLYHFISYPDSVLTKERIAPCTPSYLWTSLEEKSTIEGIDPRDIFTENKFREDGKKRIGHIKLGCVGEMDGNKATHRLFYNVFNGLDGEMKKFDQYDKITFSDEEKLDDFAFCISWYFIKNPFDYNAKEINCFSLRLIKNSEDYDYVKRLTEHKIKTLSLLLPNLDIKISKKIIERLKNVILKSTLEYRDYGSIGGGYDERNKAINDLKDVLKNAVIKFEADFLDNQDNTMKD